MRRSIALSAAILFLSAPAFAEDSPGYSVKGDSANEEVAFDDDALLAPGQSAYGDWFEVRPPAPRVMLLRPRTSFVTELLISIGAL